jgi:hypothetical protein
MTRQFLAAVPSLLLIALAAVAVAMNRFCIFQTPPDPCEPFSKKPGLALELADSLQFVDEILGTNDSKVGPENRKAAVRLQHIDYVLIPLYAAFFIAAALELRSWPAALPAIVCACLAAIFDVAEDIQIIRMVNREKGSSARRFGKLKWFFYFATLAAEGALFFGTASISESKFQIALGIFLIAVALAGMISSVKGSFQGIAAALAWSLPGLIGLVAASWIAI